MVWSDLAEYCGEYEVEVASSGSHDTDQQGAVQSQAVRLFSLRRLSTGAEFMAVQTSTGEGLVLVA